MPTRILLVEDDDAMVRSMRRFLEKVGYVVLTAKDGVEGLRKIEREAPDMVILDERMPNMTGSEMLQKLREEKKNWLPVIMLTEIKHTSMQRAEMIFDGADDYLNKPFDPFELLARIEARLRRTTHPPSLQEATKLCCAHFCLDRNAKRVVDAHKGGEINLTRLELALLEYLMLHPDTLLTSERLLHFIREQDYAGTGATLRKAIQGLRDKLGDDKDSPRFIETEWGAGYRFIGEVLPQ